MDHIGIVVDNLERLKEELRSGAIKSNSASFVVRRMDWIGEAVKLLKSYQPRVMELDEVLDLQFDDVVYVQSKATGGVTSAIVVAVIPELPDIDIGGVIQFRQACGSNGIYNAELGYYGKTWRCWTAKPSGEQRRETAWND